MAAIVDIQQTAEQINNISLDDIQSRHRRERKELQAKIQALKKDAPKSDKKKRKEALEKIKQLEMQLAQCQADEIQAAQTHDEHTSSISNLTNIIMDNSQSAAAAQQQQHSQPRISKAQKRRDKKAQEARERDEKYKANADINIEFDPKTIETQKLQQKLKQYNLALYVVPSDGDCLYNAIRHQLIEKGLVAKTVQELRCDTANYIYHNKDNLIPYMTNPDTGDLLTDAEFDKYCEDVRSTSAWGGQIELKALSSILKAPIEILQADGSPTIQGDEYQNQRLVITYHRYMYTSGEHYNSTIPFVEQLSECDD